MRIITTTIAMLFSLVSAAIAGGGSNITGHPLVDTMKGKQEAKAGAVVPLTGAVVVTGYQSLAADGNDDVYTVKYTANGTVVWRATLDADGRNDLGTAIAIDKSGDAIVAATVNVGGVFQVKVVRYQDNGTSTPSVIWSSSWTSTPNISDVAQALAYDPVMDRVYVAGYSNNGTNDDFLLLAFDNSKTGSNVPLWTRTYNRGGKDRAYAAAVSTDGSTIALSGESHSGTDLDMLTVMWQSDGVQRGTWPKGGASSFNDRGTAVAFTPAGNAVVTGYVTSGRGGDIYTAELNPASEAPVWETTFDAGFDDYPAAVVVDAAGDAYVAGTIGILPAFAKMQVLKYHNQGTTTPQVLWKTVVDAGSANAAGAVALALDPSGSLFVAGWRDHSGVKKVGTMRIGTRTGRILWSTEWSGIIGNNSVPVAIGTWGQGVVTGGWTDRTEPLDGGSQAATGGSKISLQNSGKQWTRGQWTGYTLYMVGNQVFRRILDNDQTTLYLAEAEALPYPVAAGDLYYIYDKDNIDLLVLRQEKGVLAPPTGLSAKVLTNNSVGLTFEDNTETETNFTVDVRIGENGTWNNNAYTIPSTDQTGMNTVYYEIPNLLTDTEYYFRVRAFDNTSYSDYSPEVSALTRLVSFSPPPLSPISMLIRQGATISQATRHVIRGEM